MSDDNPNEANEVGRGEPRSRSPQVWDVAFLIALIPRAEREGEVIEARYGG
jgi:hypothetical protein